MANKHKTEPKEKVKVIDIPEVEETKEPEPEVTLEPEVTVIPDPDEEDNNTTTRTKKIGKVVNCERLNVRAEAYSTAEVISMLPAGAEVIINKEKSNDSFYNITTSAGLEGFCMVDYISN